MNRRILVRISPIGSITVEVSGFRGHGCEAATRALEETLGRRVAKELKPEHRIHGVQVNPQSLGGT